MKLRRQILLFALILAAPLAARAQDNLYEAIEKLEEGTLFQEYLAVVPKEDGSGQYEISMPRFQMSIEIIRLPSGTPAGVQLKYDYEGKTHYDAYSKEEQYGRNIGYPEISAMRDKTNGDGYLLIGDYFFKLEGLSKDGLDFQNIEYIYIKKNKKGEAGEKTEKKKMSLKERLAAAKAKIKEATAGGAELQAAQSANLDALIKDYLKAMKAKQDKMTAAQKAENQEFELFRKNKEAYIKAYNDSLYNTPAERKARAHRAFLNRRVNVTVKNNSNHTYYIGSSKEAFIVTEIAAGSSSVMTCTVNMYYYSSSRKGTPGRLFYTADSACGSSVILD